MNTREAKEILRLHNQWRRGAEIEQQSPEQIGIAIDVLLEDSRTPMDEEIREEAFKRYPKLNDAVEWSQNEADECRSIFIEGATFSRTSFHDVEENATKELLDTIISWEKDLSEYHSLESKLRELFNITKIVK